VQVLALEYLRFADGRDRVEREREGSEHRQKVLETIVRGSLVATGEYEEKTLFEEYFGEAEGSGEGGGGGDADVDFDYSDVNFQTPDESEMEILARMLADTDVSIDGGPIEGPGAEQVSPPDTPPASNLPAPRELDITQIEQDPEWT
jgi:hypothetical protein